MSDAPIEDEEDVVSEPVDDSKLSAFADFLDTLNLDDLDDEG
jgi:hypothetical protein